MYNTLFFLFAFGLKTIDHAPKLNWNAAWRVHVLQDEVSNFRGMLVRGGARIRTDTGNSPTSRNLQAPGVSNAYKLKFVGI